MTRAQTLNKLKNSVLLHFAVLLGAVFVFAGNKPPFENEYIYLLRLKTTYNSDFLLNDVSFAVPATEHWVFNHLFGLLTYVFSLEFISWTGRILCWTVLLYALTRLAKQWEIPLWLVTAAIFVWLCFGQAVVAHEWIIGSFEAKCIAYICLLFALEGFSREKAVYPSVLLGLTFSFHPAVGLWGVLAAGMAMVICRWPLSRILTAVGITFLFTIPGLVPLLTETARSSSAEDWKFIELVRFPHIFDPFTWSKSSIVLVYLQLVFCVLFYYSGETKDRRRFLPAFLIALGLIFTAGLFLRVFEQYELLRFMPMRLFPVFAPLFFLFTLAEAYNRKRLGPPITAFAAIGFVCVLIWPNPLKTGADMAVQTYRSWTAKMDDIAISFVWLRENTPNGTTVIAPPWRNDFWYLAQRAQVASAAFPTYVDLGQWRGRVEALSGESLTNKVDMENDQRPAFYRSLSAEKIAEAARDSGAQYLVSDGSYPFSVVFTSGDVKVYSLDR